MNRLSILLLFAAVGCDFGATDLGTIQETESGSMSGGAGTSAAGSGGAETSGATAAPTTETTSGQGSTSGSPETSAAATSSDTSTSSSTNPGSDSSGGETGGSTGEPDPVLCELEACWAECSAEFDALPPFEGETPCYGASEGWAAPPCETMGEQLCPTFDAVNLSPEELAEAATCFLEALQGDEPGHLSYYAGVDLDDYTEATLYLNGDGTVLLDARASGHCGNGGTLGTRFIMTRNLDVIDEAAEAFQTCITSDDPAVLRACVLGEADSGLFNPDALPWLAGSCSAEAPMCVS